MSSVPKLPLKLRQIPERYQWFALCVILAMLVAWMLFRPDRIAKLEEASPEVVTQLRAMLPAKLDVSKEATLRFREVEEGGNFVRVQKVHVVGPGIINRNTKAYAPENLYAALQEQSSISVGPIILVRHFRTPPPIAGDLLPRHFWYTRVLKKVNVRSGQLLISKPGDALDVDTWAEILDAEGGTRETEVGRLNCVASARARADTLHSSLTGEATKIVCTAIGPANAYLKNLLSGVVGSDLKDAVHFVTDEIWYIDSLGFTVLLKSTEGIRQGNGELVGEMVRLRTLESIESH